MFLFAFQLDAQDVERHGYEGGVSDGNDQVHQLIIPVCPFQFVPCGVRDKGVRVKFVGGLEYGAIRPRPTGGLRVLLDPFDLLIRQPDIFPDPRMLRPLVAGPAEMSDTQDCQFPFPNGPLLLAEDLPELF